jgi:hypothetical protein
MLAGVHVACIGQGARAVMRAVLETVLCLHATEVPCACMCACWWGLNSSMDSCAMALPVYMFLLVLRRASCRARPCTVIKLAGYNLTSVKVVAEPSIRMHIARAGLLPNVVISPACFTP